MRKVNESTRDRDRIVRGLLLSLVLTVLVGIIGGLTAFFALARKDETTPIETRVSPIVPQSKREIPLLTPEVAIAFRVKFKPHFR
ncbi:MAG: hypothetical protein SW833_00075 [Cyanobacteriota bacterium]|nr:hypothetical protein [Cyanobacteriota bacterium]